MMIVKPPASAYDDEPDPKQFAATRVHLGEAVEVEIRQIQKLDDLHC